MTKVVVFGHSHVWSVLRALGSWSHPELEVQVPVCGTKALPGRLVTRSGGKAELNPVVQRVLDDVQASDDADTTWLISMVQGNYYNQLGMFAQGGAFDFILPDRPLLVAKAQTTLLPYAAVKAALGARMEALHDYLPVMAKTAFRPRLIVVGPPPPVQSNQRIAEALPPGEDHPELSPSLVRLKLWQLQNTLAQGYCRENGIQYLPGDLEDTQTPKGFLRPKYVKDSVHANHFYSAHLLDEIARRITDGGPHQ